MDGSDNEVPSLIVQDLVPSCCARLAVNEWEGMGTGASQLGSGRGTGEVNFVARNSLGDVQACDVRPRGRTRP